MSYKYALDSEPVTQIQREREMAVIFRYSAKTMALSLFFLGLLPAGVKLASAEVYEVGGSDGWTVGHTDYAKWASSKIFHVGDIIMFEYNKLHQNVLEVSRDNFHACNADSPIATYTTGNDSIVLQRGHYYYICGFPGHCSLGQKVDIRVPHAISPSPSPLPSPPPPPPSTAPTSLIEGVNFALAVAGAAAVSGLIIF